MNEIWALLIHLAIRILRKKVQARSEENWSAEVEGKIEWIYRGSGLRCEWKGSKQYGGSKDIGESNMKGLGRREK